MKYNTLKSTRLTFRAAPVISAAALLCLLVMGGRAPLRAAGLTWDAVTPSGTITDGTGAWNVTNSDWFASGKSSGTSQWVNGDDAQFGVNGNAPSNITTNTTVTLGTNITVGNLDIANDSKLGTFSIVDPSSILTITGSLEYSPGSTISGTVDFTNGLQDVQNVTIGGVLQASAGNYNQLTLNGVVSVVGGINQNVGNSTLNLSGTALLSGNISDANGAVNLSGSIATMSGSAPENLTDTGYGSITMSGGTYSGLALGNITVNNNGFNVTMSGGLFTGMTITGTIGVTAGTLNVSGANGFSNVTGITNVTINGGVLQITTTGSNAFPTISGTFGLSSGALNVNGGLYSGTIGTGVNQLDISGGGAISNGTFNFNVGGSNPGGQLVWAGTTGSTSGFAAIGGTFTIGQNATTANTTLVNPMDLDTSGIRVIKIGANGKSLTTLSGSISDSISGGGLEFGAANNTNQGYNWVMMTGGESYSGSTVIGNTTSGTSGNGDPLRLILAGSGSYSSSTYALTGTAAGQLGINQSGTAYVSGNIITLSGTDNTTNDNNGTQSYDVGATVVIGGTGTAVNGVSGSNGLVVFTGTNTYVGNTNIDSGTLQIGNGGTAGQLPLSLTGTVVGKANTALVYDLTGSANVENPMSGAMGFTQAGAGVIVLNNGANQLYTGTTTISSGTLQFGDGTTDGLTTGSSSVIANSGVLVLNNVNPETYSGSIGGNGSLVKSAAGNQTLSGNLGYTGTTGVNAGTLTLSGSNGNATAITVNNNGTLALGGTNGIAGASSLTLNNGGTLNLALGGTTHVITMAGSAANALVFNGGTLNFGMGTNTADELVLTTGSALMSGIVTITATPYGTLSLTTPQPLIFAPGGGLVTADFTAPSLTGATFTLTSGTLFLSTGVTITNAYWKGNNGVNWSADNTWTSDQGGATASLTGPTATLGIVFSANGAANESSTVMDVNESATSLTINNPNTVGISGTHTLTLSNNAAIVTGSTAGATTIGANINLTGALPSIAANSTNPLTISGTIEGSTTGLQVTGTGLLALTGTNTYTGATNITSGTVQINNAGSLGPSTNPVTFTGGTSGYLQVAPSVGTLTDPHNISFGNTGVASTVDSNGNTLVLSGSVTGSGTFNSVSTAAGGITTLTGSVSGYTGNITVGSGVLQFGNGGTGGALSTTPAITVAGGAAAAFNLSGATNLANTVTGSGTLVQNGPAGSNLEISGSQSISNYVVNGGTMSIQTSASLLFGGGASPTGSITVNSGAEFLVLKGDPIGGAADATPNVTVTLNSGTLNFSSSGAGGLSIGNLNLNGGTVIANGDNYGDQYPSIYIRGSTITVGGSTESFIQQTQPTNAGYDIRLSGTVNSSSDSDTFNVGATGAASGVDLAVSANLEDGFASNGNNPVNTTFIKTGAGTMSLSGSNAWGGGTQINGGVLELLSANALPLAANGAYEAANTIATGTVGPISFDGGTLEYSGSNQVDYSANFSTAASQAFSINTNGQNVTYATGLASSGGSLSLYDTAVTTGTLSLNGVNTYSGATTVYSGNLAVNGSVAGAVNVSPNNSAPAVLSGTGTISGLVTATTGTGANVAHVAPALSGTIGTLTLSGGLTLTAGTNLDFTLSSSSVSAGGGVNDLINLNGGNLTLPASSGTITVNYTFTSSTPVTGVAYTLIDGAALISNFNAADFISTGTGGQTPTYSVSGSNLLVTFGSGGATSTTYTLVATPGQTRVIQSTGTTGITSVITNTGTVPNDSLAYTNLGAASATNGSVAGSTTAGTLALTQSATNTTTYTAGSTTGTDVVTPTATGSNATLLTAAAGTVTSGTVDVVANRVITGSSVNFGDVLAGVARTGTTGFTTTGDDQHFTRVTLNNTSATDGTATVNTGTGSVLFNGAGVTTTRTVSATFGTSGATSGTVSTLAVTGEGLNSEVDTAPTVAYSANVFQAFSGSSSVTANSGTTATLGLTNLAPSDSGQRAGATITGYNTSNGNFVVTTDNGGVVGNSTGATNTTQSDVGTVTVNPGALSGTYNYSGNITASAQYTDTALQSQGTPTVPGWNGITLSATVSASGTYGQTNTASIGTGGSFTGYGFTSSSGSMTTAVLLNGTASAPTTLSMKFSSHGSLGGNEIPASPYQSSDTLTLGGLAPVGGTGPDGGSTTTDAFVLQMSVSVGNPNVIGNNYYIGWFDPNAGAGGSWVNAIAGNSNAVLSRDYFGGTAAYFNGSYAAYEAANPGLTTAAQQLGAYGYDSTNEVAWAVLNYDSDVEVIPEPGTYALVFSGFGMLVGFQRFRRRSQKSKK